MAPKDPKEPASSLQLNGDIAQSRGDTGLRVDCRVDSAASTCSGTTRSQLSPRPEMSGTQRRGRLPLMWPLEPAGRGHGDQVNTKGLPLLWLASTLPSCILPTRQRILTDNREQTTHIGHHEDTTGPRTFMSAGGGGMAKPALPLSTGMPGRPPGKSKPAGAAGSLLIL